MYSRTIAVFSMIIIINAEKSLEVNILEIKERFIVVELSSEIYAEPRAILNFPCHSNKLKLDRVAGKRYFLLDLSKHVNE